MIIEESYQAKIDYSQAVVRISKRPTLAESPLRYNKITFVALPGEEVIDPHSGGLAITSETPVNLLSTYLLEDELSQVRNFQGTIKLHNDLASWQAICQEAKMWGVSLLLSSGASDYVLEHNLPLPTEDLYCWLTISSSYLSNDLIALASQRNLGLMLNQAKDERLLYTISHLMQYSGRVLATNAIINDNYSGINSLTQADLLAESGISFWLKTVQKCYPFALFLGKEQAYCRYYDAIIEHEVREAVAQFIHAGHHMGQLDQLGNSISMAMGRFAWQMQDDLEIEVPKLASLSVSNRKAGIVDLVEIRYSLFGEVRMVSIAI